MAPDSVSAQRTLAGRQRALLRWYRAHGRHHLPWRHGITPYRVLVSEVMLQQTQVDRVIPYFTEWMRRWPTVEALARTRRADVIRAWGGLGYNRRAVSLHAAAREIVQRGWPARSARALTRLPGVGPYTAHAILAFAGNLPAPCVDTNVRRVLAHVILQRPVIMRMPLTRVMRIAARVIPKGRGRDWNSALMDYGALVFTARNVHEQYPPSQVRYVGQKPTTESFEGSRRFWRGRIVAVLRGAARGRTLAELRCALRAYGVLPRALMPLLRALERDEVIARRHGVRYHLG